MGYLKINQDEFLEVAELSRWDDSLRKEGFVADKQNITNRWGIVRNKKIDPNFEYMKIVSSSADDLFRIKEGYAYDKDRLKMHYKMTGVDITIPVISTGYYVVVEHTYNPEEVGTVSVGGVSTSLLSGVGTAFTTTLRGQPNFPSKIRFTNSVNYTGEYTVLEVVDDTNVTLDGVFPVAEANLKYVVVGTFTPSVNPPSPSKDIFQYDDCTVTLMVDVYGGLTSANYDTFYATLTSDKQFVLGYVSFDGMGIHIVDLRYTNLCNTLTDFKAENLSPANNPMIAIQNLKKFNVGMSGDFSFIASIDWKFNITAETQNNTLGRVTIGNGYGGTWLDTTPFVNGMWDGWRYYYADGSYSTISSSFLSSGVPVIILEDGVRMFSGSGVCITPYAEEMQIMASFMNAAGSAVLFQESYTFPINSANPTIRITSGEIINSNQQIKLEYAYRNNFSRTALTLINTNTYYNELAYDQNGTLISPTNTNTDNKIVTHYTVVSSAITVPDHIAMAWFPNALIDFSTYFDATGLGLADTKFFGWALCNGLHTTRDLRGRTIVGSILGVPAVGAPALDPEVDPLTTGNNAFAINTAGGAQWIVQTVAQMANHAHTATQVAHDHTATQGTHSHTFTGSAHQHSTIDPALAGVGTPVNSAASSTANQIVMGNGTSIPINTFPPANVPTTSPDVAGGSISSDSAGAITIGMATPAITVNAEGGTLGVTQQMNLLNPWSTAVWVMRIS